MRKWYHQLGPTIALIALSATIFAWINVNIYPVPLQRVIDFETFVPAATSLWNGDLAGVYDDSRNAGGPAWLTIVGVIAHPHIWTHIQILLAALFLFAVGMVLLVIGKEHNIPTPLLILAVLLIHTQLVNTGMAKFLIQEGHASHLVVFTCWVVALRLLQQPSTRSSYWAAALLGVAIWWEPWALLGTPALLFKPTSLKHLLKLATLTFSIGVSAWLPFLFSGSFALGQLYWHIDPGTFWDLTSLTQITWPWRLIQAAIVVLSSSAIIWTLRKRTALTPWLSAVLAATALILTRLIMDPIYLGYYVLVPVAAVVAVVIVLLINQQWIAASWASLVPLLPVVALVGKLPVLACTLGLVGTVAAAFNYRSEPCTHKQ